MRAPQLRLCGHLRAQALLLLPQFGRELGTEVFRFVHLANLNLGLARDTAPFELGWSPSPASITPAFTSSSFVALTITMNRIKISPLRCRVGDAPGVYHLNLV